jgi:hypothetical protein
MPLEGVLTLHFAVRSSKFLAVGVALALAALAGCAPGQGSAGNATIAFASPTDGDTVTLPFDVQLDASVPLGKPDTGNMHAHLYFDSSTDATDYDIVYGTTWQVTRQLSPGEHTIIVALANPDHSLAGPTQEIHVTVSGEGGASGGESPAPSPTDTGLGY